MKVWKYDSICVGPPVYAAWDNTLELLMNELNAHERAGHEIKEIISYTKGNYDIIYTKEDDDEDDEE